MLMTYVGMISKCMYIYMYVQLVNIYMYVQLHSTWYVCMYTCYAAIGKK